MNFNWIRFLLNDLMSLFFNQLNLEDILFIVLVNYKYLMEIQFMLEYFKTHYLVCWLKNLGFIIFILKKYELIKTFWK